MSKMINIDGFSKYSIDLVNEMLYAEGQVNPYEGQCDQKQKRETAKKQRTPEQQKADRERAQENRNKNTVPSNVRSEAAKKAAKTRRRCTGLPENPAMRVK